MNRVPRPLADLRREELLARLRDHGTARVAELAEALNVTALTIRRDLTLLETSGLVERVHGGARAVDRPDEMIDPDPRRSVDQATSALPDLDGHLAMLVPGLDFYWPAVARAAEIEAKSHGFRLTLRGDSYESVDERPALAPLFSSPDVRGVLAVPNIEGPNAHEVITWIAQQDRPCVLMEREATLPDSHEPVESVVSDHAFGAEAAVRHLWQLGHRRIGLVVSRTSPTTQKIKLGFERACIDLGIDPETTVSAHVPDTRTTGFAAAVDDVIDQIRATNTTGLLVHSDREAMGMAQHLETRGLRVPADISIVAHDDELAAMFTPALTAIRPARGALGKAAVHLLVARLADPDRPIHRITISPKLYIRESTAALA